MEALARGWSDAWGKPDLPFYFTQMQCYGSDDPDELGMADVRLAQHVFFHTLPPGRTKVARAAMTDAGSGTCSSISMQHTTS